ncbi:hypothetical protein BV20DRAFT_1050255 [Pilatotrama ljubarskyi]|nr:hypothetical protein BV20DRAFT_1050255 [Pilatotrama ljubarskyi]
MSAAPATFTPSDAVDMSKERDWPANLGMLDWDSTSIVFTKRSLLEFLKYAGVTVDPNFTNIQKLPRYATFGKLSGDANGTSETSSAGTESTAAAQDASATSDFKPTRRVRDPPGGRQYDIFGPPVEDDALSNAPPRPSAPVKEHAAAAVTSTAQGNATAETDDNKPKSRKPTSSVAGLWDAPDENEGFKPTRRVRERPGGKDSISGIFGA